MVHCFQRPASAARIRLSLTRNRWRTAVPICALLVLSAPLAIAAPAANTPAVAASSPADIPTLAWVPRSDWVNVKTDVQPAAVGDGVADDTAAIQAALSNIKIGSTIYFPPGKYRITETLTANGPSTGVSLIGHGAGTKLQWDGLPGGTLLRVDGLAYSRYVGLEFDGMGKAALGLVHANNRRFETEVVHRHLAFRGFTDTAVLRDPSGKYSLAEVLFQNCLFEDNRRGVVFQRFNDYNYTFDGCEFRRHESAIVCSRGNFYVRNSRFEKSRGADIVANPEHGSSVRRSTSSGSGRFIRFYSSVATMKLQDCHVEGWRNPAGAVAVAGGPVLIFDCSFTNPPKAPLPRGKGPAVVPAEGNTAPEAAGLAKPISATDAAAPVAIEDKEALASFAVNLGGQLKLLQSNNRPPAGAALVQSGHKGTVIEIPAGKRGPSLNSASQSFLRSQVPMHTMVLDARMDFGAKGDGKADDTAALQALLDAAAKAGADKGAGVPGGEVLAYIPAGRYVVSRTLQMSGANYTLAGSGIGTGLTWRGPAGGTILGVSGVRNGRLEQIAVGHGNYGNKQENAVDILHTGAAAGSDVVYDGVFTFGVYQKDAPRKGMLFQDLGPRDTVQLAFVQGNLRFVDCARATILANVTYEGAVTVEGKKPERDGFLGFGTRLNTHAPYGLTVRDSHSVVLADFYMETMQNAFLLEGNPGDPPGRITVQDPKLQFMVPKEGPANNLVFDIRNFKGQVFAGPGTFYQNPKQMRIKHEGDNPLDLFLLGPSFYDARLEVTKGEKANIYQIGAHTAGMTTVQYDSNDTLPSGLLQSVPLALDDLRRLGELDLRLNHPHALAGGR